MKESWLKKFFLGSMAVCLLLSAILSLWMVQPALAQETATLTGTVTSGLDGGEPLEGVTVTLATAANEVDTIAAPYAEDAVERFDATTDSSGAYSFTDVPPGDYVIFATGDDLADLTAITLVLQEGESQTIDFSMTPGGSIIGEITSSTLDTVYGGEVTLFNRGLAVQTVFLRSDGTYLFEHVIPGNEYQVFAQTATEAVLSDTNLEVAEGEALEIPLEAQPAARLVGVVTDDTGAPIARALVSVESPTLRWSGLTDDGGRYDLTGAGIEYGTIIPGTYDIRVRADGHAGIFEGSVNLGAGQITTRDFTLNRAGVVTGVVTTADGQTIADATVSAVGESGSEYATLTRPDGTYSLDLLDTDLTYTLFASTNDDVNVTITDITVNRGKVLTGIDFTLPAGTFVAGMVSRADGSPANDAIIDLFGVEVDVRTSLADADGVFAFNGVPAGEYVLVVSNALQDVGYVGSLSVADGTQEVTLTLEETGVLTGTATNASVVQVTFNGVTITVQPVADDGTYEVFGLAPGSYEVTAISEAGRGEPTAVEIEAGAEATLDVQGQ